MMRKRPCKKIRAKGWRGMLGIVSPSKMIVHCPCDKLCKWYKDSLKK